MDKIRIKRILIEKKNCMKWNRTKVKLKVGDLEIAGNVHGVPKVNVIKSGSYSMGHNKILAL